MARNPLSQLATLGEEVLGKASQNPTASRVLHGAMQLRDRVDDLAKRVRGLEQMEKRLAQLEKRLAKLEGKPAKAPAASAGKTTTPRKPASAKKPSQGDTAS
jgi:TolA-binding protein